MWTWPDGMVGFVGFLWGDSGGRAALRGLGALLEVAGNLLAVSGTVLGVFARVLGSLCAIFSTCWDRCPCTSPFASF